MSTRVRSSRLLVIKVTHWPTAREGLLDMTSFKDLRSVAEIGLFQPPSAYQRTRMHLPITMRALRGIGVLTTTLFALYATAKSCSLEPTVRLTQYGTEITIALPPAWYHTLQSQLFSVFFPATIVTVAYMFWTRRCAETLRHRFDERLKERTRLARDLHDTVLQTIQGSKMVADDAREYVNDPQRTGLALDRLSEWLDRASIEGRAALEALRSSSTEANDLEAALLRVADDCITGARMSVHIALVGHVREFHPIAGDEIYRIASEAIRNACAHSGARNLWIQIAYQRRFQLTISDNGQGVDQALLRAGRVGHFGIAGMRERALFLGGKFSVLSSPATGTAVSIVISGSAIYRNHHAKTRRSVPGLASIQDCLHRAVNRVLSKCPVRAIENPKG
jgi:signal transduction histidine kinase